MQLLYTPTSHFARKVRIVASALGVDLELLDVGNVANLTGNQLDLNPLMKVPTLIDGDRVIFDSDVICAYLVRRFDPADSLQVLTVDTHLLNARTVMNGIMAAEVELILAARTGLNIHQAQRFDKHRRAISAGLEWLEARLHDPFGAPYNDLHLVCLWDHLEYRTQLLPATGLAGLRQRVLHTRRLPYVAGSQPEPLRFSDARVTL